MGKNQIGQKKAPHQMIYSIWIFVRENKIMKVFQPLWDLLFATTVTVTKYKELLLWAIYNIKHIFFYLHMYGIH